MSRGVIVHQLFVTIVILYYYSPCLATQDVAASNNAITSTSTSMTSEELMDAYVIAIFTGFCALCLSFIGLVVGYYAFLEDQLMRRYQREGVKVKGQVIHTQLYRTQRQAAANPCSPAAAQANECEYLVVVNYKQMDDIQCYTTAVQKQVRARESDFAPHEEEEWERPPMQVQIELANSEIAEELKMETSTVTPPRDILYLLILPGSPRSALPCGYVERACSIQNRLPTYALVVAIFIFSGFFVHLGTRSLPGLDVMEIEWAATGIVTSTMLLVEFVAMYCSVLGDWLNQLVDQEYVNGEDLAIYRSDETLSTLPSNDSFFCDSEQPSLTV